MITLRTRSFFFALFISVNVCADKIFLTDLTDSAIYVGDNNGPNFFSSSFRKLPVSGVEDPVGVDYDYRNEMVYWTDEGRGIISRAKLDGSMQEVLVDDFEGVGYPEGLVLDLEDERMIWTDTLLEKIESANLDGSSRKTIINTGLNLPWSITLSYKRRMLYWTEHGDDEYINSKIEMATKYGLNRRTLVSTRIKQPNGVALDGQEQRLYWTEGFYDVIESIDLDNLDRQVHVYAESGDIFVWGISLYFDSIYFTEWGSSMLYEVEPGEEEIRTVSVHALPVHVKVYADLTCPHPTECQGHSTCELIGYETPSCTCLPGYTGPTCNDEITCPLPSNVNPDTHFEDPSPIYYNSQTLIEVCDNGNDRRTHVCNGFTGDWYTTTSIDCTKSSSGLPQGAVIGISCGFAVLAVLFLAVCWRAYASSRRTIPTTSQNPIPTASYPGSSTQVQGMPTVIVAPPGAVGGAPMAPPVPQKGQIPSGQLAPVEMPPPGYEFVVYSGSNN
nr:low-density lipoprotein receptor-related protein 4-like [Lytechinus pictus]